MPLFVFCSGYFSLTQTPHKVVVKAICPYFAFQIIYFLFFRYILDQKITLNFTTPIWTLWYLLAIFMWSLMLPVFKVKNSRLRKYAILTAFLLGLIAGYDQTIGYYLSLSRIIMFFPFFLLGYYLRLADKDIKSLIQPYHFYIALTSVAVALIVVYKYIFDFDVTWTYGVLSYAQNDYNIFIRTGLYILAFLISVIIVKTVSNKKKFISKWGENSLTVYLLHGLIVKYLIYTGGTNYINQLFNSFFLRALSLILISILIVVLLSSDYITTLLHKLLFLERFCSKTVTRLYREEGED